MQVACRTRYRTWPSPPFEPRTTHSVCRPRQYRVTAGQVPSANRAVAVLPAPLFPLGQVVPVRAQRGVVAMPGIDDRRVASRRLAGQTCSSSRVLVQNSC